MESVILELDNNNKLIINKWILKEKFFEITDSYLTIILILILCLSSLRVKL